MRGIAILCLLAVTTGLGGCGLVPTPLQKAVLANDTQSMKVLLDDGADANELAWVASLGGNQGIVQTSALNIAAWTGNCQAVGLLLDHGADPNLVIASWVYRPENTYYFFSGTAIMTAAVSDRPEVVELLLDRGAEIDAKTHKMRSIAGGVPFSSGADSLFLAASAGNARVTELLLARGADPNTESAGVPVLMEAAFKGRREVVGQLLDHHAKIQPSDKFPGPTADMCHMAADYYQSSDPGQALDLYKLAAMYYPIGAKVFDDKATATEFWIAALAATGTAVNQLQAQQQAAQRRQVAGFTGNASSGPVYYTYHSYENYPVDTSTTRGQRLRAAQYRANGEICESIVELKEKYPERSLSDCVRQVVGPLSNNQER